MSDAGPGGDDDRASRQGRLGAVRVANPDAERARRQVDPRRLVREDLGAEAARLGAEPRHQLGPDGRPSGKPG